MTPRFEGTPIPRFQGLPLDPGYAPIPSPRGMPEPPEPQAFGSLKRGGARLSQAIGVAGVETGLMSPETAARGISQAQLTIQETPPSKAVIEGLEEINASEGFGEALLAIVRNPSATFSVIGESLPMSVPSLALAAGGSLAGPVGTGAGAGAGSAIVEYSASMLETMQAKGISPTDREAVAAALQDPAFLSEARERAATRGVVIGAFDALTAGLAGKLLGGAKGAASVAIRGAGEALMQAAGGAGGEAAALLATGEELRPGEITLEGVAELVPGAGETALNLAAVRQGRPAPEQAPGTPTTQPQETPSVPSEPAPTETAAATAPPAAPTEGSATPPGAKETAARTPLPVEAITESVEREIQGPRFVGHEVRESEGQAVPKGKPAERGPRFEGTPVAEVDKRTIRGRPKKTAPPKDVLEFIAQQGGMTDVTGELKGMDLHLWHREKPFRSKIVREGAVDPDRMREAAAEQGYLPMDSTVADFYDLLDQAARAEGQAEGNARGEMEHTAFNLGIPEKAYSKMDDAKLGSVIAYEIEARATAESADSDRELVENEIDRQIGSDIDDTFGTLQGEAPEIEGLEGQPAEGTRQEAALPDRDAGGGGEVGREGEVEQTAQGEQRIIPGAEQITEREQAERQMEGAKKPTKPQKDADEGLFDVAGRGQTELFTFPGPIEDAIKPITEAYTKQADKVLDWLGRRVGWPFADVTLRNLPGREGYLTQRNLAKGRIGRAGEIARHLNDMLRKGDETSQKMAFAYLTTEDANPEMIPDAKVRNAAIAAKSTIKKLGKELVRRGLLSQEAYDKHADAYLPRTYLKHLLAGERMGGAGLKTSKMGYLKQRMDLDPELREIILGEVTDPGFLTAKAIALPAEDMAVLDFLRNVSQNEAWVFPDSLVTYRGQKVTPFWLKSEAERLRRQARHMEEPKAERAKAIAEEMDSIADVANPEVPEGYTRMPDSPRYGELRGMVVRKDIFQDVVGAHQVWFGDKPLYAKAVSKLRNFNAFWKMMKVPFNPPTQVRNFISNSVLLNISGVDGVKLPGLYVKAFNEILNRGKHYRIALKYGVPMSTFSAEEIYKFKPDLQRVLGEGPGLMGKLHALAEPLSRAMGKAGDLYQFSETWGKVVKITDAMEKGATEEEAVLSANKALFDYSLVPGIVRDLRTMPIGAPFITFYYKAAPQVIESAVKRPGKILPYLVLPYLLSDVLIASLHDVNEDDVDKLREALPSWLKEQGSTYVFPWKDEKGRWQAFNYGYFLPWTMHVRSVQNLEDPKALMSELGVLGGPVPQIITALQSNIDPFTQRRIVNPADPPEKQITDLMNYAWTLGAPSWLTDRGVLGHMWRAVREQPNYYGEPPLTETQAGLRMFGVNIYPSDPMESRRRNLRRMNYEITETKRRGASRIRDKSLSQDEKNRIRERVREQIDELQARRQEYVEQSLPPEALR